MDGMHDIGGKQGFGRVRHAPQAPVFHEDWEKRMNALYAWWCATAFSTWTNTAMPSSAWNRATT